MCHNFFVGQVCHGLYVHDVVNLDKAVDRLMGYLKNLAGKGF